MSDNRRVYRTIITKLRQLYPKGAKGNVIRHLNTLAGMIAGCSIKELPVTSHSAESTRSSESGKPGQAI